MFTVQTREDVLEKLKGQEAAPVQRHRARFASAPV